MCVLEREREREREIDVFTSVYCHRDNSVEITQWHGNHCLETYQSIHLSFINDIDQQREREREREREIERAKASYI